MPLGAARLNTLSKVLTVAAADTNRSTGFMNVIANGDAQLSNAQYKFRTGTRGGSIYMDGTGDYLSMDDNSDSNLDFGTNDFTIEWFQYLTSLDRFAIDMRDGSNGAKILLYSYQNDGSASDLYLYVNSGNRITATGCLSANTWQHIALVRESSTTTLYVDGSQVGSTYSDSNNYQHTELLIWENSLSAGNYTPPGYVDEFRISDTARYSGASLTVPTSAFTQDNNTRLLLHGDGPYGSNGNRHIVDDIGDLRPLDIHIEQNVTVNSGSSASISTAQSKFGGSSLRLNDNNSHCQYVSPEWGSAFTIEFWFRADALSGDQFMAGVWGGSPHGGFNWTVYLNGSTVKAYTWNGSFLLNNATVGTASANTWHHFALTWDGSTYRTFLDGTMGGTASSSTAPAFDQWQVAWVGTVGGTTSTFAGYIDEYRQSDTARYTSNFTPSSFAFIEDDNTKVLLHFDGTNGDTTTVDGYGSRTSSAVNVTLTDNAHISTDQAQFGSTSVELDGTNDAVDPDHGNLNIGSGDFTIEFWYYPTDLSTVHGRYFFDTGSGFSGRLNGYFNSSSQFVIRNGNTELLKASHGMSTGQWYHLAIVRQSGTLRFFRDGTSLASVSNSTSFSNNDYRIGVYLGGGGFGIVGYVDEFRHSSVARYSGSSFTVPTEAFTKDGATELLLHFEGSNGDTTTSDDA